MDKIIITTYKKSTMKKLKLNDLLLKSFITELSLENIQTINGADSGGATGQRNLACNVQNTVHTYCTFYKEYHDTFEVV